MELKKFPTFTAAKHWLEEAGYMWDENSEQWCNDILYNDGSDNCFAAIASNVVSQGYHLVFRS